MPILAILCVSANPDCQTSITWQSGLWGTPSGHDFSTRFYFNYLPFESVNHRLIIKLASKTLMLGNRRFLLKCEPKIIIIYMLIISVAF